MVRRLMKGNEAIGEAAIKAGCRAYFCYPITPQTEVAEYLAKRMPEVGGVFLQGESEVAVAYMVFGAAGAGKKVFTTSSSPGISLMAEGISYVACAELPVVYVNIMRAGPGLGGILPTQSDYFQATKGGGHGDYRLIVLAPASVQEAVDHMLLAFDLAEKYRTPVMLVGDGMIGQMMEPVELPDEDSGGPDLQNPEDWATTGCKERDTNLVKTLFLDAGANFKHNQKLAAKYKLIEENEIRVEEVNTDGELDVLLVAYGTMARICRTAMDALTEKGLKVGMIRPITLFPFPLETIRQVSKRAKLVVDIEMSMGQMIEDVDRAIQGKTRLEFYGKTGGIIPTPNDVSEAVLALVQNPDKE
jgi:2-oxoglutarate/2-oxoacid ferredoxin oxidoreductase subunit alpha